MPRPLHEDPEAICSPSPGPFYVFIRKISAFSARF